MDNTRDSNLMKLIQEVDDKLTLHTHIISICETNIGLFNNDYRMQSEAFTIFFKEAKKLLEENKLNASSADIELLKTDIGEFAIYEGINVPLDLPMIDEDLTESDKPLNKPMRSSGPKKFKVYVKNPKTGNIKQVNFGAKDGGQNLAVKINDKSAREAFAKRHKCDTRNDKTTPSYWSCRLPRYAKQLGLSGGGNFWW